MAETLQQPESPKKSRREVSTSGGDVTTERYKGPSALVAGAGEGSVSHFALGLGGLGLGFALTFFAHKPVGRFITNTRNYAFKLMETTKGESKWGKFLLSTFGHGKDSFANMVKTDKKIPAWKNDLAVEELAKMERGWLHEVSNDFRSLPGVRHLLSLLGTSEAAIERVNTSIMGGGLMGAFGFFVLPIAFWFRGAKHAHQGKDQFRRAREEILEMRDQYDSLREKYAQARVELEELKPGKPAADIQQVTPVAAVNNDETPKRRDDKKPGTAVTSVSLEQAMAVSRGPAIAT